MNLTHQQKAQLESLISSAITLAAQITGGEFNSTDQDVREQFRETLLDWMESFETDETSWSHVKDRYFYDVYLQMRTEAGTLTRTDETRSGLNTTQFSDNAEYHRHCIRVAEARKEKDGGATKICSSCGQTKPISRFKRKGGAVCNACQGKAYRAKKAAEAA